MDCVTFNDEETLPDEATTLRAWLATGERFHFKGLSVDQQCLTDHYSAYLDAQVEVYGGGRIAYWLHADGRRSHDPIGTITQWAVAVEEARQEVAA